MYDWMSCSAPTRTLSPQRKLLLSNRSHNVPLPAMFSCHPPSSPSSSTLISHGTPSTLERRRAQYKASVSISPCRSILATSSSTQFPRRQATASQGQGDTSDSQRSRMRHLANAVKNRKNQREETQRARRMSCGSDGFDVDVDMAEEASDEEGYDDEVRSYPCSHQEGFD